MATQSQNLEQERLEALQKLNGHHYFQVKKLQERQHNEYEELSKFLNQTYDTFISSQHRNIENLQASIDDLDSPENRNNSSVKNKVNYLRSEITERKNTLEDIREKRGVKLNEQAVNHQSERRALATRQSQEINLIENSANPLWDVKRFTGRQQRKENLNPEYKIVQPGLGTTRAQSGNQALEQQSYRKNNVNSLEQSNRDQVERSPLEQVKYDLSQDKENTHYDEIERLQDYARDSFNYHADNFNPGPDSTIERN